MIKNLLSFLTEDDNLNLSSVGGDNEQTKPQTEMFGRAEIDPQVWKTVGYYFYLGRPSRISNNNFDDVELFRCVENIKDSSSDYKFVNLANGHFIDPSIPLSAGFLFDLETTDAEKAEQEYQVFTNDMRTRLGKYKLVVSVVKNKPSNIDVNAEKLKNFKVQGNVFSIAKASRT